MRYKLLGRSGLRVSEFALGTMTFGPEWGWGSDKQESQRVFDAYVKDGGNFIDTANRYTEGTSEKYVGEFIKSDREHFVLATKYTLFMRRNDPNFSGNHRKNMVQSLEASLKRLDTDYIDLYWVHAWDFMTPVEEVMRALDDLVRAGKVLYVGISDAPAWIVSQANTLADLRGWSRFVGLQVRYSLADRAVERELLPMARALDIGVTVWGVLAGGILSGKYNLNKDEQGRASMRGRIENNVLKLGEKLIEISKRTGASPSQIAMNWVRQQEGVIIPIIGARTESQLQDNLGCLNFTMQEEDLNELNELSKIDLGFPHDFLQTDNIKDLVYGGTWSSIDNHRKG